MASSPCAQCGRPLTPGYPFCPACGARVAGPGSPTYGPRSLWPPAPSRPSPDVAIVVAVVVVVSAAALVVGLVGLEYGGLIGRGFCHCAGNTPLVPLSFLAFRRSDNAPSAALSSPRAVRAPPTSITG